MRLVGLVLWFILWLPGLVWVVNACLGGRLSWVLIESSFLLLYSLYATVEMIQTLSKRGEQIAPEEQGGEPTLVIEGAPTTVKDAFAHAKQAGGIREVS
jgi:hypothetical protein